MIRSYFSHRPISRRNRQTPPASFRHYWLGLLAICLLMAPRVGSAQSTCLDFESFVHTIGGTKLPATTGSSGGSAPGIVILDHPYAAGARLAFITNSDLGAGHHLTCVDVTNPDQLADPVADADQLADLLLTQPGTDIVVDPAFPARPYLYLSARDLDLIVIQVADADTLNPTNRTVTLTVIATKTGVSGPGSGTFDANSLAVQARVDSTILFVYETGAVSTTGRIRVYDASIPTNPQLLATTPGSNGSGGEIVLRGTTAYTSNHYGINVFNIRNAASPSYVGGQFLGYASSLALSPDNNRLYVTGYSESSGDPSHKPLRVFDVSMPLSPVFLASAGTAAGFDQAYGDIVIAGSRAYMDCPDGLQIADISNPLAPTVVGRASGMGVMGHISYGGVAIQDDYAFVTGSSRGLRVMQLGSRTSPATYSQLTFASYDMARADSGLVVGCSDGFRVLNTTIPTAPTVRSFVAQSACPAVTTIGNMVYLCRATVVESWNVANPAAPVFVGWLSVGSGGQGGRALATRIVGGTTYLYVAVRTWVVIVNVTNPAAMTTVALSGPGVEVLDITVRGNYLYAVGQDKFAVLSLANASSPTWVGSIVMPGEDLAAVTTDDAGAYAVGRSLHLVDVTVPTNPTIVHSVALDEITNSTNGDGGICVDGGVAYVIHGSGGLQCADTGEWLLPPRRIGSLNPPGPNSDYQPLGTDILIVNGVLYGADGANGLWTAPTHCSAPGRTLCCTTPANGGNAGQVQVIISGFNLDFADLATLTRVGENPIPGTIVSTSIDQLVVQFDLTGRAPGAWSVVAHDPGEGDLVLPDGFTIESGGAPIYEITILGPTDVRAGSPSTYDVLVSNSGNVDGISSVLVVSGIPLSATAIVRSPYFREGSTIGSLIPGGGNGGTEPVHTQGSEKIILLQAVRIPVSSPVTLRFSLSVPMGTNPFDITAQVVEPINPSGNQNGPCNSTDNCIWSAMTGVAGTLGQLFGNLGVPDCVACALSTWLASPRTSFEAACTIGPGNCPWFLSSQSPADLTDAVDDCTPNQVPALPIETILSDLAEGISELDDCGGLAQSTLYGIEVLSSIDPNDKIGPSGVTAQHHLPDHGRMYYTVMFENQPAATLPAREVRITDTLPTASVDAATLRFHQVGCDSLTMIFPAPTASFVHDFDLRPGQDLLVRVEGSVDIPTGVVTVFYQGLDPVTGLPPANPLVGWLPPNVTAPQGEGRVIFSVSPLASVGDGSTVCNEATIVFDANPPIQTPAWCNVFDLLPPSSDVSPLDTLQLNPEFLVQWGGSDAASGLLVYDIFVSANGGPRTFWTRTSQTQKLYPGLPDGEYDFYSSARDSAGNAEPLEGTPDASTRVVGTSGVPGPPTPGALSFLAPPIRNPAQVPVSLTFGIGTNDLAGGTAEARLAVYDVRGRLVRTLISGAYEAGLQTLNWDGRDQQGGRVSAGLFFMQLKVGARQYLQRIVLLH